MKLTCVRAASLTRAKNSHVSLLVLTTLGFLTASLSPKRDFIAPAPSDARMFEFEVVGRARFTG